MGEPPRNVDERKSCALVTVLAAIAGADSFPILGEPATAVELGERALWWNDEALGLIGSLYDFEVEPAKNSFHRALELRPLIAAVGVELEQDRVETKQSRNDQFAAVAARY